MQRSKVETIAGAGCFEEGNVSSQAHAHKHNGESCDVTLPYENKILKRAVLHLADRYRRMEANVSAKVQEAAMLQHALEQSQEVQRRLAHSNEMLQGHLRLQMN